MRRARRAVFYALLVGLWQALFALRLWPQYLFPSPAQVLAAIGAGLRDGSIVWAAAATLRRLFWGYVVGLVAGAALGLAIARRRELGETLGGFLSGLRTVPPIAWLPPAILWYGASETAIAFVVAMAAAFPIALASVEGLLRIPNVFVRAGRNLGISGPDLFLNVKLPAAMPSIVAGLKHGWSSAWRSLLACEIVLAAGGLGHLLNTGRELNDMSQVVAVLLAVLAAGVLVEKLFFGIVEKSPRVRWGSSHAQRVASG